MLPDTFFCRTIIEEGGVMELDPIDPDEVFPDSEGIPKSLQQRLDEYNQNFERLDGLLGDQSLLESSAVKELRVEETKAVLAQALPVAVNTLIGLCGYAQSESVKLKAAQFLIGISLGKDPAIKAEDPAKELIKRLQTPVDEDES
jgi:hypothetical protein